MRRFNQRFSNTDDGCTAEISVFGVAMNTATPNQTNSELETTKVIKLSLDGQKRLLELSKKPPAPTAAMKRLKSQPDFATRTS